MERNNANPHERFLTQFTANEPAILAYVRTLVPTRLDAADVMQGVALVLWRKFDQLEGPEGFRSWAFGVARYEALAWRRDKARDRLVLGEDVLDAIANQASANETRLEAQRDALDGCLDKLPIEQRTLILAAYRPDADVQHVAERSGRTVAAFYQWLHRTRLRLRECTRRALQTEGLS